MFGFCLFLKVLSNILGVTNIEQILTNIDYYCIIRNYYYWVSHLSQLIISIFANSLFLLLNGGNLYFVEVSEGSYPHRCAQRDPEYRLLAVVNISCYFCWVFEAVHYARVGAVSSTLGLCLLFFLFLFQLYTPNQYIIAFLGILCGRPQAPRRR